MGSHHCLCLATVAITGLVSACTPRPTCLVLSAGATKGYAHVGALRALKERGQRIDCVTGSSMGSLIGALYASAPAEDTDQRYRSFEASYMEETRRAVEESALVGGILLGLVTGGVGGVLLGAVTGGGSVAPLDHERVVMVLGRHLHQARIEELAVPYRTLHLERRGTGLEMVIDRQGDVATAVGASIANPLIFADVDPTTDGLDPGVDRMATTPVEETCAEFPEHRLIAINVSGTPVVFSPKMRCPLLVVDVAPPADPNAEGYEARVDAGYRATLANLGSR